jgi:hypothetical protein
LKRPCYDSERKIAVDSDVPLISKDELDKILASPEQKNLVWNNYFVDIGDGKKYQGQWVRNSASMR